MAMYCSPADSSPQALQDTAKTPGILAGPKQRGHLNMKWLRFPSIRESERKCH